MFSVRRYGKCFRKFEFGPGTPGVLKRAFGNNLPELKRRIGAIKSIKRVCESMNSIAAVKLPKLVSSLELSRGYSNALKPVWNADFSNNPPKKHLLIVNTSNLGLCGSSNTNVTRRAQTFIADTLLKAPGVTFKMGFIGEKGEIFFNQYKRHFAFTVKALHEADLLTIDNAAEIVTRFVLPQEFDQITLFYNFFESRQTYKTVTRTIQSRERCRQNCPQLRHYENDLLGTEEDMHLNNLYDLALSVDIFNSILESLTVEMNCRLLSMTSAVKNIDEMVKEMQITYNSQRQESITTEICEINAGKMAVMLALGED